MPLLERSKKKFVTDIVATLGLGLLPRQGFARLRAKNEVGSHTTYSWECESL